MNKKKFDGLDIILLIIPFLFGGISFWIWYTDMTMVLGWEGVDWVKETQHAIFPITSMVVIGYMLPQMLILRMPVAWSLFYIILLFIVSIIAFEVAKDLFIELYKCRIGFKECHTSSLAWSIWKLLGLAGVLSIIYFIPIRHFHHSTEGMHILTILVAFVSTVPASLISLEQFHPWAESSRYLFIEAVKMGYPALWLPIFLGLLSWAAAREWI